ncbi:hypothetical protein SPRG_20764 [Saprolegnia parasitica CBS 223.65]|uniref:Uncharacterized protein n=1 Tax=Saprolegnia parasitica (strain CBS 223.65) TaxID=695850 RepID=A0A067C7T5_SAPPC|nr:hypothetical protein SPRG_20764 [Saprolegnia parasitica CBS 223.65]KDO25185.1 hypothetical protein SPRG_20764 [Saprolegnia parasitica CBS 223.65]|eukprot:XP_012204100.1 hypothetical protein SPRG_20764 [Saprolegnia parasitica CBS 223.65]
MYSGASGLSSHMFLGLDRDWSVSTTPTTHRNHPRLQLGVLLRGETQPQNKTHVPCDITLPLLGRQVPVCAQRPRLQRRVLPRPCVGGIKWNSEPPHRAHHVQPGHEELAHVWSRHPACVRSAADAFHGDCL